MSSRVAITMLNSMAAADFAESLDRQREWGIRELDLKDAILGKDLLALTDAEAARAAALIAERGQSVLCLSSPLFGGFVEDGPERFRREQLEPVGRLVELARAFRPRLVRLLAARTRGRAELPDAVAGLRAKHPWVFGAYREALGRLRAAGFAVTVENEVEGCILSRPEEVRSFFAELGPAGPAPFTWDVQNLWQMGTFPSLAAWRTLKPLVGYLHLKGGRSERPGGPLRFRSTLEKASWPVAEIVRAAVRGGVTAICLNPSHGEAPEGYDPAEAVRRDLAFVRAIVEEASP